MWRQSPVALSHNLIVLSVLPLTTLLLLSPPMWRRQVTVALCPLRSLSDWFRCCRWHHTRRVPSRLPDTSRLGRATCTMCETPWVCPYITHKLFPVVESQICRGKRCSPHTPGTALAIVESKGSASRRYGPGLTLTLTTLTLTLTLTLTRLQSEGSDG